MAAAVSLFAGPGGLDLGARQVGVEAVGIEWDPNACATRRAAGLATVQGDVRAYGPADFSDATVLLGGPPCQTFTNTGNGTGRRDLALVLDLVQRMAEGKPVDDRLAALADERTGLVLEPLRWALAAAGDRRPYRVIVLEQVPAVLPVWQAYAAVLAELGYSVAVRVVNAVEYGVPQTRRRAVLAARLDGEVTLPEPTHEPYRRGVPRGGDLLRAPWVSMGEALPHRGRFEVVSNYGTGGDPKRRGRRSSDEPAATVTGKISRFRVVGPDGAELPRLTHAEAGMLQTFPADWPWSGRDIPQQIGNAVPVRLAAHVVAAAAGLPAPAAAPAEEVAA